MSNVKKIVYWGTGNICRLCLEWYPEKQPSFYIDSKIYGGEYRGKPVKSPEEIKDWTDIYVVIAVSAYKDIEKELEEKGLIRHKDFAHYRDYFGECQVSVSESLKEMQNFLELYPEFQGAEVVYAPAVECRNSDAMIHFFNQHSIRLKGEKSILITRLNGAPHEQVRKKLLFPVFGLPAVCGWNGYDVDFDMQQYKEMQLNKEISERELIIIEEIENRKTSNNREFSAGITKWIYIYYREVFRILKPSRVIIWGCFSRECFLLEHLSGINHIPYGFMEYGWIPGTYQFDRFGIAGRSEYAVFPEKLMDVKVTKKALSCIREIKAYITERKLDSRTYRNSESDNLKISHINRRQKTVFFVGMDDYGMGINPESKYYNKYVCSIFRSTKEAVLFFSDICKKNSYNLIFKPHPNAARKNMLYEAELPENVILVEEMQVDFLIELADVVVSIASTVDYKTLIYGKPLISLGQTTLKYKRCVFDINSLQEIEPQMLKAMTEGMTNEQNLNFELHMAQLLKKYLWDDLTDRKLRYGLSLDKDFFESQSG